MRPMPAPLGLYIHIPFCKSKCVYCDFYSLPRSESRMDDYTDALCAHLAETAPFAAGHLVDTVYFGGGTPSYLGTKRLVKILKTILKKYKVDKQAEITLEANPDSVVVIDEAYVDFGGESCVPLTKKYSNLLVVQTYSKSRSMAGARLGYAIGDASLIQDLETIKFSTNPFNVNQLTMKAGAAALAEQNYYDENCKKIMETRDYTTRELEKLGFSVLPSKTNFIFAKKPGLAGAALYQGLKERGVLVRYFDKDRIRDYNRITIGTREQMDILLEKVRELLQV